MALFKVYHGDKNNLPSELKDSYGYMVVNEEIDAGSWTDGDNNEQEYGIGEWYIDTDLKRYRIAAAKLIDEEGNIYDLDDIVQKIDIVDDLVAAAYDDINYESNIALSDQEKLRKSINVAKDEDSITKAYIVNIPRSGWSLSGSQYVNTVTLGETLKCGKANASVPVPPLIVLNVNQPNTLYNIISNVELNDAKTQLTFYIEQSDVPASITWVDFSVIVIDHR